MGIDKLDYILKGMQPKTLITLIAKTGTGKTWFLILVCAYCVLNGYRPIFFTTEMAEEQIEDR
jgi:replicative DNA helicase